MGGKSTNVGDYYAKYVTEVAPAIEYVDSYLEQNGELPTQRAFQKWAKESGAHMLIIWDREHEYAAKHGAKKKTDYLVGTWMSDWYFYYRSWDGDFIDASDDRDTGFSYGSG